MMVFVAAYYFVVSLVALRCATRRAVVFVVLIVIALNTLGAFAWHRQARRSSSADGRTTQQQHAAAAAACHADVQR
jgi:nicotinamide riboside transporter PnuC